MLGHAEFGHEHPRAGRQTKLSHVLQNRLIEPLATLVRSRADPRAHFRCPIKIGRKISRMRVVNQISQAFIQKSWRVENVLVVDLDNWTSDSRKPAAEAPGVPIASEEAFWPRVIP